MTYKDNERLYKKVHKLEKEVKKLKRCVYIIASAFAINFIFEQKVHEKE